MIFLKKIKAPALLVGLLLLALVSCEEDLTTLGGTVVGSEPFSTGNETYPVFAVNKKINAVQTNRLPLYQLGVFNDAVYGRTEAQITSQLLLPEGNPTFGASTQDEEDNDPDKIPEAETVTEVVLYIPYLSQTEAVRDMDNDGVDDFLDEFPEDPNNDDDGDTLTNAEERALGTNPLEPDTDNDGIDDNVDEETLQNNFPKTIDIDSIYGNREAGFRLTVSESEFFLRDFDPQSNFTEQQEYFNTQRFDQDFLGDLLYQTDTLETISNLEYVFDNEDDPDTEENEALSVTKADPGIRVVLSAEFFQENLIDKEGSSELRSQANFNEFLRGIHIALEPIGEELMLLLNLNQAEVQLTYTFESEDPDNSETNLVNERTIVLNLLRATPQGTVGNAVNTIIQDDFPAEVIENFNESNASRIYLKGGAGSYSQINLFSDDTGEETDAITNIKAQNWIINEANLVFYVDRTTLGDAAVTEPMDDVAFREPFRLYLFDLETGIPIIDLSTEVSAANTLFGSFLNYDGLLERDENGQGIKYTVRITDHINDLILRDQENVALGLMLTPDISTIGNFRTVSALVEGETDIALPIEPTYTPVGTVLFGSGPDVPEAQRLQLEIFYTEAD